MPAAESVLTTYWYDVPSSVGAVLEIAVGQKSHPDRSERLARCVPEDLVTASRVPRPGRPPGPPRPRGCPSAVVGRVRRRDAARRRGSTRAVSGASATRRISGVARPGGWASASAPAREQNESPPVRAGTVIKRTTAIGRQKRAPVCRCGSCHFASCLRVLQAPYRLLESFERLVHLGAADVERRAEPDGAGAARQRERPVLAGASEGTRSASPSREGRTRTSGRVRGRCVSLSPEAAAMTPRPDSRRLPADAAFSTSFSSSMISR